MKSSNTLEKLKRMVGHKTRGLIDDFLEYQYSLRTKDTYLTLLNRFVSSEKQDPLGVTVAYLENYVRREVSRGIKPSTIKTTVNTLRSFLNFVQEHDDTFQNPVKRFRLRIPKTINEESLTIQKKLLTQEQVNILLERFRAYEEKHGKEPIGAFLLKFALNSSMRISEIVSLEHFDPSKDCLTYHNYLKLGERAVIRVLGKARKLREFRLSTKFSGYLNERFANAQPGTPVFLNAWGKKRLTRFAAHCHIKKLQKRFMSDMNLYAFGCHALRHTGIGVVLGRGEHPIHVARMCGNTPEILSRYYLHDTKDILKDVTIAI